MSENTTHLVVTVGPLRVMVTHDDGSWFAHGLELDYAAEGPTVEVMQGNFEKGLQRTIVEHLRVFGNVDNLILAPAAVWIEFFKGVSCDRYVVKSQMVHEMPEELIKHVRFERIEYFTPAAVAQ